MNIKRRYDSEESKNFWDFIYRFIEKNKKPTQKFEIGDQWLDSKYDLSPTLLNERTDE